MKKSFFTLLSISIWLLMLNCSRPINDEVLDETIYVRHEGADMPAYVHGNPSKKTFLVVVHGAGSFGLSFRKGAFTDQLEKEYVVVYFDQRGQSMSQGAYKNSDQIIDLMAGDVQALLNVLQHEYGEDINLFLMGHSLGGLITCKSLNLFGVQEKLRGWINVDGLLDIPEISYYRKDLILEITQEQISKGKNLSVWEKIKEETELLSAKNNEDYNEILNLAGKVVQQLLSEDVVNQPTNKVAIYRAIIDNNPIHWLVANYFNQPVKEAIKAELSLLDQMVVIQKPSLFIYGKYDVSVPPDSGKKAFEKIIHFEKEFHLFDESIHHPMDSEPDKFGELVFDFIERYR